MLLMLYRNYSINQAQLEYYINFFIINKKHKVYFNKTLLFQKEYFH
jgi:hypothetical protein